MSRIAKADVNRALDAAAKSILAAGGRDGRTSRADMKAALGKLPATERRLADIFFKFIDNRDFRAGAQVTSGDVKRAVAYAKQHMVANYDLNNNGLSKTEIAKMSLTGKRAVDLAKALKGVVEPSGNGAFDWAQVSRQLTTAADNTFYVSETDSQPEAIAGTPMDARGVTEANVRAAFGDVIARQLDTGWSDLAMEIRSAPDSARWLREETEFAPDDEQYVKDNAAGFARLKTLLDASLTDARLVKVGPRDDDGTLATDRGTYQYYFVGKTPDGRLAGIHFESAET